MSEETKTFKSTFLGMSTKQQENSNGTPFHWGVVALDINGETKSFPVMIYDAYQAKAELKANDELNIKFDKVGDNYIASPEGNGNDYERASKADIEALMGVKATKEEAIEA